jgi:hypothetical protein
MAASYLSRVNLKLAQTSYIIGLLEVDSAAGHRQKALIEASLFHLNLAFIFYVRELAELNGVKAHHALNSVNQLDESLRALARQSSDVRELSLLVGESGSWLKQLLGAYDALFFSAPTIKVEKAFPVSSGSVIPLVDVLGLPEVFDEIEISIGDLKHIHSAFMALVIRQRETNTEC